MVNVGDGRYAPWLGFRPVPRPVPYTTEKTATPRRRGTGGKTFAILLEPPKPKNNRLRMLNERLERCRRVVERTLVWLNRYRWLTMRYEQ